MFNRTVIRSLVLLPIALTAGTQVVAMDLSGDPRLPKSVPAIYAGSFLAHCILRGDLTPGVAFHESDWWHNKLSDVTYDHTGTDNNPPVGFFTFNIAKTGPFAVGERVTLYNTQNSSSVAALQISVTVTKDDLAIGDATFQRNCVREAGAALDASEAASQETAAGAGEYHAWCSRCHGVSGRGDGPVAISLEGSPVDLTTLTVRNGGEFPTERVRKFVDGRQLPRAHGTPEMPVWGEWFSFNLTAGGLLEKDEEKTEKLIRQKVDRIVSYLRTLQRP